MSLIWCYTVVNVIIFFFPFKSILVFGCRICGGRVEFSGASGELGIEVIG